MGKLVITTATTVDGVVDEFEWYVSQGGHEQAGREQFADAAGWLLGRKTYEGLAGYWPAQEGPWADLVNPLPKLVASRTLSGPLEWNARVLEGELAEAVPGILAEADGDLVVTGCGELARSLLAAGLVDELRFWVHPVVWGGGGARPFAGAKVRMGLLGSETFDSGVTLLRYEPLALE